jgi:hypothetical protein
MSSDEPMEHVAELVKEEGFFHYYECGYYECGRRGSKLPRQFWSRHDGETDNDALHRLAERASLGQCAAFKSE